MDELRADQPDRGDTFIASLMHMASTSYSNVSSDSNTSTSSSSSSLLSPDSSHGAVITSSHSTGNGSITQNTGDNSRKYILPDELFDMDDTQQDDNSGFFDVFQSQFIATPGALGASQDAGLELDQGQEQAMEQDFLFFSQEASSLQNDTLFVAVNDNAADSDDDDEEADHVQKDNSYSHGETSQTSQNSIALEGDNIPTFDNHQSNDLPVITNAELEQALDDLALEEPIVFPSHCTRYERRMIVKEKLCDFATSVVIQLTLSTTPEPSKNIPNTSTSNVDSQASEPAVESQYRILQAEIANRPEKASFEPIKISLFNRQAKEAETSKSIKFPTTAASTRHLNVFLRLLDLLTDGLDHDNPYTLRDIYYGDTKLFGSQKIVDGLVDDIAATLNIRRRDLNVVAASKGLATGHLSMLDDRGRTVDCTTGVTGHLIPPDDTIETLQVETDVEFVLVVEKEAVFQTLCSTGFVNDAVLGKSILITGKGYPDVATRELVRRLCLELPASVPILCLVDADPHGLHIFLNYRNGSNSMAFDNANLVAPRIQWLGVKAEDMTRLGIDEQCLIPLSMHDYKRGLTFLRRDDLDDNLRRHVQHMLHLRVKAEIQLLGSENPQGLLQYLRREIPAFLGGGPSQE